LSSARDGLELEVDGLELELDGLELDGLELEADEDSVLEGTVLTTEESCVAVEPSGAAA
jgi:hypothetical protein